MTSQRLLHSTYAGLSGAVGSGIICYLVLTAFNVPAINSHHYLTDNTLRFITVSRITNITNEGNVLFVGTESMNYEVDFTDGVTFSDNLIVAEDTEDNTYLCFSPYIAKSICYATTAR